MAHCRIDPRPKHPPPRDVLAHAYGVVGPVSPRRAPRRRLRRGHVFPRVLADESAPVHALERPQPVAAVPRRKDAEADAEPTGEWEGSIASFSREASVGERSTFRHPRLSSTTSSSYFGSLRVRPQVALSHTPREVSVGGRSVFKLPPREGTVHGTSDGAQQAQRAEHSTIGGSTHAGESSRR
eukprot:scaffold25373_cov146-Isochrysis_galbana.AAC.2